MRIREGRRPLSIVNALEVLLKRMKQKRQLKKIKIKNCPQKRCPGGRRLHPPRPQSVFEEDEAEEAAESSSSKCWPGYTYVVQLN